MNRSVCTDSALAQERRAGRTQWPLAYLKQLGPGQLPAVVHLLETMVSPVEDGDALSNTERKAVAEADEWLKHNQPIPHEEVLAELGLTMEDWGKMAEEPLPKEAPRRNG